MQDFQVNSFFLSGKLCTICKRSSCLALQQRRQSSKHTWSRSMPNMDEYVPYSKFVELSCARNGRRNTSCWLELKSSSFMLKGCRESVTSGVALELPMLNVDDSKCLPRLLLRSMSFEGEKSCSRNLFN
jgi:hypothetical protein